MRSFCAWISSITFSCFCCSWLSVGDLANRITLAISCLSADEIALRQDSVASRRSLSSMANRQGIAAGLLEPVVFEVVQGASMAVIKWPDPFASRIHDRISCRLSSCPRVSPGMPPSRTHLTCASKLRSEGCGIRDVERLSKSEDLPAAY